MARAWLWFCLWIYLLGQWIHNQENSMLATLSTSCILNWNLLRPCICNQPGPGLWDNKSSHWTHKSLLQAVSLALLHECSPLMSLAWASFRWSSADLWEVRVWTDYRSLHADFCSYSDKGCHVCLLSLHLLAAAAKWFMPNLCHLNLWTIFCFHVAGSKLAPRYDELLQFFRLAWRWLSACHQKHMYHDMLLLWYMCNL